MVTTWIRRGNSIFGCAPCSTESRSCGWTTLLCKQSVVEVEYLLFANWASVQLWHRHSVFEIHLPWLRTFGVQSRGKFYDAVGTFA